MRRASERRGFEDCDSSARPPENSNAPHVWSNGAPLVLLGWAGVLMGCLAAGGLEAFDPRARVEFGIAAVIAIVVFAVGMLIALATFPSAGRAATG